MITVSTPNWGELILVSGYTTSASYTSKSCRKLLQSLVLPDRKVNVLVIGDTHIGSTIIDLAVHFEETLRIHVAYSTLPYLGYPLTQKWLIQSPQTNVLDWVLEQSIGQWLVIVNSFSESREVKRRFIDWSKDHPTDGKIFIFPLQM